MHGQHPEQILTADYHAAVSGRAQHASTKHTVKWRLPIASFHVCTVIAVAVWRAVAEDYAPFDVDVTTIPPAANIDKAYVSHACIGGNGAGTGYETGK
jgi:hypothetical protein